MSNQQQLKPHFLISTYQNQTPEKVKNTGNLVTFKKQSIKICNIQLKQGWEENSKK